MRRPPSPLLGPDARLAAAGLVALLAFAATAAAVGQDRTALLDRVCLEGLQRLLGEAAGPSMRWLTEAGSLPFLLAVVLVWSVWCLRRGEGRAAFQLGAIAAVEELANVGLKVLFHRLRPSSAHLQSYSFPSGHAMAATAMYGMLGVLLARAYPRLRRPLAAATIALAALIGISRVYLGFHWASDVLGGFAAGGMVLVFAMRWTRPSVLASARALAPSPAQLDAGGR